jgi:type I phosphodiesterase/nucleotide pyrophosphatase
MQQKRQLWRHPLTFVVLSTILVAIVVGSLVLLTQAHGRTEASCQLHSANGNIQHVIYMQFDNVHFTRDNPNIPSDLEQMPNLLNFMQNNGVVLSNHHTPLIAHTATNILTSLTGVYPDSHGIPVSNSFRYFNPDGTTSSGVAYAYWTDPLYDPNITKPTDMTYNMLAASGKNAPAPWVPYTRAGCDFGAVASANTVLENIATDIPTVFGANSPEAAEVASNPKQAFADFVGIGIHCALGNALCSSATNGKPDKLPDELGGYSGYTGLFGHKYVAPQISPNKPLTDLDGHVIQDEQKHSGFPGFDGMSASVSLSYVAAMQEHGVPVTYAYISDVHDAHPGGPAYGPGHAGYVAALKAYNEAFGQFFIRLAKDGINASNTLFVFTADEGDHFVGGAPSPANCDGLNIPCTYSQIGELNGNMTGLLATQQDITTPFKVHADSAPTVYLSGNPARDAAVTRTFERATGKLTAVNPITGKTDTLTNYLADPVEMKLLHMITADARRTPTFTLFADPNYLLFTGAANCSTPCVAQRPEAAWNHGDVSPDINTTWLGIVGPGVSHLGVDRHLWSDHTDTRPTMLALLGLQDDYAHDGRVLFEALQDSAVPQSLREHRETLTRLAEMYKQINAPVGKLGLASLRISTEALESGSTTDDSTYTKLENQLIALTDQRNALASQMLKLLEAAAFNGQSINEQQAKQLIDQGQALFGLVS